VISLLRPPGLCQPPDWPSARLPRRPGGRICAVTIARPRSPSRNLVLMAGHYSATTNRRHYRHSG